MDEKTEALLFAASRRQHLAEKVIPALKMDKVVLCDRFVDSSLVYQGIARGIGIDAVMNINSFAIDEYMPDVTFLLDLDPEIGLMRINKNKDREVNRLDLEKIEFHQKIREGYLFLMNKFPSRIIKIDASKDIESIASQIFNIIIKRINSEKS
jgi:dTMP kinase